MRFLFSSSPEKGHLFPMLPFAAAVRSAGQDTAALTSPALAGAVAPLRVLPVGPDFATLLAENVARTGGGMGSGGKIGAAEAAQFYAGTRIDVTAEQALDVARDYAPDIVLAQAADYIGPLVATALGVPWARFSFGPELPAAFTAEMEATVAPRFYSRGLSPAPRIACLDPWPDFLQAEGWAAPPDRIGLRPEPHTQPDTAWTMPLFPGREDRPMVLLTQGTNLDDRALYTELLEAVLRLDVNVLITLAVGGDPDTFDADHTRVRPVGFVPFGQLLRDIDVVISPGGNGTVLGALSAGVPLVLFPMFPSHRWSAEAASATGSAAVVANPREVGPALETVLSDPAFRSAARAVADRMARATSVDAAVAELTAIMSTASRDRPS